MHATDAYWNATPWVVGFLVILSAGLALLWRGLRGRCTDDHPLCRRCRFDLTGLPASGANCPECGADLAATRATVVGHRERRGGPVALGLAMLIPAVLLGGGAAWWAAGGFDPTPYKPAWLLMREADAPTSPAADAALAELGRRSVGGALTAPQAAALTDLAVSRLTKSPAAWDRKWGPRVLSARDAGRLSAAQVDAVTDRALAIQADPAVPWDIAWGDWVEAARAAGRVSDARWRRYARQAAGPLGLTVRRRLSADAAVLPFGTALSSARLGEGGRFTLVRRDAAIRLDGGPWLEPTGGGFVENELSAHPFSTTGFPIRLKRLGAGLTPGPHRVAVRVPLEVREAGNRSAPPLAAWGETLAADVTVLPAGEPSAAAVADPALGPAVLRAFRIRAAHFNRHRPGEVDFNIDVLNPPMNFAFDVIVRDAAGREWPMRAVHAKAHEWAVWAVTGRAADGAAAAALAAGPIDVLLRPSAAEAERSVDLATYWGRPVIFRGVRPTAPETGDALSEFNFNTLRAEAAPPADATSGKAGGSIAPPPR